MIFSILSSRKDQNQRPKRYQQDFIKLPEKIKCPVAQIVNKKVENGLIFSGLAEEALLVTKSSGNCLVLKAMMR
jgi:hypothetical protein